MKKSLFIIAATALVVSCASNDIKNDIAGNDMPIGFSKVYIENNTKAFATGAYNSSNFEHEGNTFGVIGYKNATANNVKVFGERTGETEGVKVTFGTDWTYSPLRYWDKTASSYNFYAYAPHSDNFTGTVALASNASNAFSISGFKQATTQPAMIDLMTDLTSKATVNSASTNPLGVNDVEFTFTHILSNINLIMAVSGDLKADYSDNPVTVKSVTIGEIKMDGEYGYNDGYKWSLTSPQTTAATTFSALQEKETNTAVFGSDELKAIGQNSASNLPDEKIGTTPVPGLTNLLFVPQAVDASYAITIKYEIADEEFNKTINLSEFKNNSESLATWAPGNKYNYVLVIGPTPILFDIKEISEWGDGGTYTYIID